MVSAALACSCTNDLSFDDEKPQLRTDAGPNETPDDEGPGSGGAPGAGGSGMTGAGGRNPSDAGTDADGGMSSGAGGSDGAGGDPGGGGMGAGGDPRGGAAGGGMGGISGGGSAGSSTGGAPNGGAGGTASGGTGGTASGGMANGGAGGTNPMPRTGVLFIAKQVPLAAHDELLRARLVTLGFDVEPIADANARIAEVTDKASVFVSESANSATLVANLVSDLRNAPIPVLLAELFIADNLGLAPASATDFDSGTGGTWKILLPDHPLAGGLPLGNTDVWPSSAGYFGAALPLNAIVVATDPVGVRATLFGFEKNDPMDEGFLAPDRRTMIAFEEVDPLRFTDNAWKLFDAAAKWGLRN